MKQDKKKHWYELLGNMWTFPSHSPLPPSRSVPPTPLSLPPPPGLEAGPHSSTEKQNPKVRQKGKEREIAGKIENLK